MQSTAWVGSRRGHDPVTRRGFAQVHRVGIAVGIRLGFRSASGSRFARFRYCGGGNGKRAPAGFSRRTRPRFRRRASRHHGYPKAMHPDGLAVEGYSKVSSSCADDLAMPRAGVATRGRRSPKKVDCLHLGTDSGWSRWPDSPSPWSKQDGGVRRRAHSGCRSRSLSSIRLR